MVPFCEPALLLLEPLLLVVAGDAAVGTLCWEYVCCNNKNFKLLD
jgi:hypothetical protein